MLPGMFPGGAAGRSRSVPVVNGTRTTSEQSSTSTAHTVTLPGSIAAGELLLVLMGSAGTFGALTFPAGYTELTGSSDTFRAAYAVATGSEGSSISVPSATATRSMHIVYRISNYTGVPVIGTQSTGTSANPDPPSITPSWGSDVFLVVCGYKVNDNAAGTAPSGYSNVTSKINSGASHAIVSAEKSISTAASSENPGTFGASGSVTWYSNTIAIRGA